MPKNKPIHDLPSKKQLDKLTGPYSDSELSRQEPSPEELQKLMTFFDQYGIDYSKFKPEHLSFLSAKLAYPNDEQYVNVPPRHDVKKWMLATKNIQYQQKAGLSYQEAVKKATVNWKKMEVFDFLNWLRFYQEGTPMKYKTASVKQAQNWYESNQPGYFLHIKKDAPVPEEADLHAVQEENERNDEKKRIIEKQRQKIIGRLDSAEKLLRMPEGQAFAGQELESLMEAIYQLKKKVQLVNKLSISTRLYEDMIVREANVLSRQGFVKGAEMLYSLAQTPGASAENAIGSGDAMPEPEVPANPSGAGQTGVPAGLPATAPGVPSVQTGVNSDQNNPIPASALINQETQSPGMKEFIENMNVGNKTDNDDLEVSDHEEELMVSEAQVKPVGNIPPEVLEDVPITDSPAPARGNVANLPPPKPKEEPLEVKEEDVPAIKNKSLPVGADVAVPEDSGFDDKVDALFANTTIVDIVSELENLSKIFKTREIPRRLSIVDMMLDSQGLASYFPSLAEAQNKALDSNNYISTRVDDILAKLRGSMATKNIDLKGGDNQVSPEASDIGNKLEQDAEKEKARKQRKKEQEANEDLAPVKETPQIDMEGLTPPTAPIASPKV